MFESAVYKKFKKEESDGFGSLRTVKILGIRYVVSDKWSNLSDTEKMRVLGERGLLNKSWLAEEEVYGTLDTDFIKREVSKLS